MNAAVEAVQKQFMELQSALSETTNSIKVTEANIIALDAESQRQKITVREINSEHNTSSKMYKPIGRVYIHMTREELSQNIADAVAKNEAESDEMKRKQEVLAAKHKEISENLEDIIKSLRLTPG